MDQLARLNALYTSHAIDRRAFIQGALALGVSATALSTATRSWAADPKRGGTLRLGLAHGSTTDSLDPQILNNGFLQNVAYSFANCLTEIDQNSTVQPELAETFESEPDAKIWTFRLRKDVEFHNGKSLTADDVAASINYHRRPESTSEARVLVDQIADIKVLDPQTVQFTLSSGNADFPFLVADHHLIILPSEDGKIDWSKHIGSGPFQLTAFEPGVRAAGKRNENYFKEGKPYFDEVEWFSVIDVAARQNALISGSVDVIDQVPTHTLDLLRRSGNVQVLQIEGMLHYTFPMRMDTPPFDNRDVRLALKLAVDRQELLDKILHGHGSLGNDHPISPIHRYYAAELEQRTFDPEKAKWHVQQSGLGSLAVDLHVSEAAFPGAVDSAVLMSEQAKKAGISINVVREPNDGYWSNVWKIAPWCASYWGGRPTEDWMFSSAYISTASANESALKNERLDAIIAQARSELDEQKRRQLYFEAQQLVRDEGGSLIPMFANHIHGLAANVRHGEKVAGNWQLDGHRATERWWFE